jgi:threonylcarbamoyladenosine tRNA methylthiotransferase CDKAL1
MNAFRVLVKSYGCSANQADGETLAGCLRDAGFVLTENLQSADVIVYNCCAVKGPTENRMIAIVKRAPRGKKVVVAGCLPVISYDRLSRETRFDGVVGPAFGSGIVDVVKRVCLGEKVVALQNALTAKPGLSLPRVRSNPVVSVVPVNYGCLGSCAYCCVLLARGHLRSYGIAEVTERFKADLADGARELWITSQDVACYGRDVGANLAELLKAVCGLQGDFRVRVGMMTPNNVAGILDELVEAYGDAKVFKFLHLPVQSGDDDVLKRMRRFYTVQQFKEVVSTFRAAFPDVTLATDVICGFPGENREAFQHTLQLISEVKPDVVNVSKFFARPRTAAAAISEGVVEQAEIKRRSTEMARLAKQVSLKRNQRWVGWTGETLVDEKGKIPGSWIGRNYAYKPVVVKNNSNLLGKTLRVKIVEAFQTHLAGDIAK